MQKQPLTELLNEFRARIGSSGFTTEGFHEVLSKTVADVTSVRTGERKRIYFSDGWELNLSKTHFHILEKDFERTLLQRETQELRIIRMIGDFQLYHTVLRRYYKHLEILNNPFLWKSAIDSKTTV